MKLAIRIIWAIHVKTRSFSASRSLSLMPRAENQIQRADQPVPLYCLSKCSARGLPPDMGVNILCDQFLVVIRERRSWKTGIDVVENERFNFPLCLFFLPEPI